MDKVVVDVTQRALVIYQIKELMVDHHLTLEQTLHVLCVLHDIENTITATDTVSLMNKGLILRGGTVNQTLLFHLQEGKQLVMDMNFSTDPVGDEFTFDIADRLEKAFVCDEFLKDEFRKKTADRYFKGDLNLSRYFLIFRSLFPVKHATRNFKWNTKFGFVYDGTGLWDIDMRVAKKFVEIYKKKDIGVFLECTYNKVRDTIDFESDRIFMTKPYKFLLAYEELYEDTFNTVAIRRDKKKARVAPKSNMNI